MRTPKKKTIARQSSISSLKQLKTIGNVAEITLNYRNKVNISEAPRIENSHEAFQVLQSAWSDKIEYIEEFVILLLNSANRALGIVKISQGGISGTIADAKVIFQAALLASASGIILAHNHPGGNLKPSRSDILLTRKLKQIGRELELPVLDHIILTADDYYSFVDEGLL